MYLYFHSLNYNEISSLIHNKNYNTPVEQKAHKKYILN